MDRFLFLVLVLHGALCGSAAVDLSRGNQNNRVLDVLSRAAVDAALSRRGKSDHAPTGSKLFAFVAPTGSTTMLNSMGRALAQANTTLQICEEDKPIVEEATSSVAFNCSCASGPPIQGDVAALSCISDCSLCNQGGDVCGYTEYEEVISDGGALRTVSQGFQYTNGPLDSYVLYERSGCVLDTDLGIKCTDCEVSIDGQTCSSCTLNSCTDETGLPYQSPLADCNNIQEGATLDLCNEVPTTSDIFQVFGGVGFDECTGWRSWTPSEICEEEIWYAETSGFECDCVPNSTGKPAVKLDCNLGCSLCTTDHTTCGQMKYAELYESGKDTIRTITQTFQYTTGRSEEVLFERQGCQLNDEFLFSCSTCNFIIDGKQCNSCEMVTCDEGTATEFQAPSVDCGNVMEEAISTMNLCTNDAPTGVFHVFSYDEFNECIEESPVTSPVMFGEESLVSAANMMVCSDYIPPISTDGPVLFGSTVGVKFDGTPSCISEIVSPGLWYHVEGTGVPITASTCDTATNFVTKISVFSGPCNTLECVKESDFDHVCQHGATKGQTVTWVGTLGVMYHIRVHGVELEVGDFGLKLTSGWSFNFGLTVPAAVNDACAQAIGPLKKDGTLLVGSTLSASVETTCQDPARAIWYYVESGFATHGKSELSISTCSTQTQLNSAISVMTGDCDNLKCIDTLETARCEKGTTVSWTTPPGEKYFILVHGVSEEEQGLFGLRAVETPAVENDKCIEATEMPPNGPVLNGTTLSAGIDFPAGNSSCGTPTGGGGVWFLVNGTGASFKATTCLKGTDHATTIQVFSGSCDDGLQCTVADIGRQRCDASPYNAATATWMSDKNKTYYILVSSREANETGSFEFQVTEMQAASNDMCTNALDLLPANATVVFGSTHNATRDFATGDSCGTALDHQGTWYSYEGTGTGTTVSTCNIASNYETALSIFSGSCDDMQCVTGASSSTERTCEWGGSAAVVSWFAERGTVYFVFVHGSSGTDTVGSFGLTTTEFQVVETNDFCPQAAPVLTNGTLISGSTNTATMDNFGSQYCGVPIASPGVWYTLSGEGAFLQVSACSKGNNSTTAISVFSGPCENLKCITGKQFNCVAPISGTRRLQAWENGATEDNSFSWLAEAGETYYLLVHGKDSLALGESKDSSFELSITQSHIATMACQAMLASTLYKTAGDTSCQCIKESKSGGAVLSCNSPSCQYCNDNGTVCYQDEQMGASFDSTGIVLSTWEGFQYSLGRSEKISLDHNILNKTCTAFVDDKTCRSCEVVVCLDGSEGTSVDCENLEGGAQFVDCGDHSPALVAGTFLEGMFGDGFVQCLEPPSSIPSPTTNRCIEATPIAPNGPTIRGNTTTLNASLPIAPMCNVKSNAPGLWYRVEGTGRRLLASTCSQHTNNSTAMAIFSGDACKMQALGCLEGITSDLACAQGGAGSEGVRESRAKEFESSGSMILWRTELGTTYYIFVFGSPDDEMGTFEMTVTTKDDPEIVNPADSGRKLQHLSSLVVYIIIAITTGLMACFGQF